MAQKTNQVKRVAELGGEDSVQTKIPYNDKKQLAILGYCLTEPKFFLQARHFLKADWFCTEDMHRVFAAAVSWYDKYQRMATLEEMKHSSDLVTYEQEKRPRLLATVGLAVREIENFPLDALSHDLTVWLKARIFVTRVSAQSKELFTKGDFDGAYQSVSSAINDIKTATFENEREIKFDNWAEDLAESEVEMDRGLTFGLKVVDDLILPGNTKGGLLPGDTTILLAPTNIGKTTAMITTLVANVRHGKRVLFITHEGREADIKEKLRRCYIDIDPLTMRREYPNTEKGQLKLTYCGLMLSKYVIWVHWPKAGLTVEEVEPFIRRKQEECMAKHDGQGFDLLVNDYPALLNTRQAKGGNMNKRDIDSFVYQYFVQLALEYKFHALLAIQTNREGAKVNKRRNDEQRLLTMEDVAESYGVMQKATNVISLNRDPYASHKKRMIFYIDKSRSSETGFAVVARTNYLHAITHSDELGAIWYRGTASPADRVEDFLSNPDSWGQEIELSQLNTPRVVTPRLIPQGETPNGEAQPLPGELPSNNPDPA